MTTNYSSWSLDKPRKSGFELHELLDTAPATKTASGTVKVPTRKTGKSGKRGKVAPKYKNPANSSETWTGRGRQPIWVKNYIENGGSMDQVTILAFSF